MWITAPRNWKSAPPLLSPKRSNKLTHLGALFSFSFSLKYSTTFFSQSGLTPFWAERQIDFIKIKVQYIIIDCSGESHIHAKHSSHETRKRPPPWQAGCHESGRCWPAGSQDRTPPTERDVRRPRQSSAWTVICKVHCSLKTFLYSF